MPLSLPLGASSAGTSAELTGWVRTRRDSKAGISFIQISDGSCFDAFQVVAPSDLPNYESEILKLTTGCAVRCHGELVESRGKGQSLEMKASEIEVVGWVEDPDSYPLQPKQHSFEYLRDVAHLRPRSNTFGAIGRVRHCLAMAIHRFFHENGFLWIHTPIVTANDCEGAGEMFRVSTLDMMNAPRNEAGEIDFTQDFFGRESHLTVSRSAQRGDMVLCIEQRLHLRPHLQGGELEHQSPPCRVLDDRTRDRLRRSCG